jgi:hypothetical protein
LEVDEDKFTSFKFKKGIGESGTVSFYLSLLSSYYQKPISRELAASAFLELGNYSKFNYCPWCFQEEVKKNPTENFAKHKISSVNGLKFKVPVALKAGVKKLILSSDQKDDYEQVVPEELRRKLTVYYVKNVEELEKLFLLGEFS